MADERQAAGQGSSSGQSVTYNYYQAPVNHIGQAYNATLSSNYGTINQTACYANPSLVYSPGIPFGPPPPPPSLIPIPDASHTRNRRTSPPNSNCLAGTRQEVLEKIKSWACDGTFTNNNHLLWLCGPVGCGKSAISQAVAEEFDEMGLLLASFFFFRGSGDRSRIARLAITLASQMADVIPETRPLVDGALKASFALHGASLKTQFQRLLYRPLQAVLVSGQDRQTQVDASALGKRRMASANSRGPFLIVIDGLDECEDRDDIADFIDDMLLFFERNPYLPLRFLIASRIEEHIRTRIRMNQVHVENLHDHPSRKDITTLVRHTFKEAAKQNLVIRAYGEQWPSLSDVNDLIWHANGSFIFITTLLKYILDLEASGDDGLTPMERFELSLKMDPGLDGLYSQTLQRARDIPYFLDVVLTIAFLNRPLSISSLAYLLEIPAFKVVNVLIPLQTIICVPEDDSTRITLFHTSLRDFLRHDARSMVLFSRADRDNVRIRLACRCLQLRLKKWSEPESALPYAEEWWLVHWFDLPGPMQSHRDFLCTLIEKGVSSRALQHVLLLCADFKSNAQLC